MHFFLFFEFGDNQKARDYTAFHNNVPEYGIAAEGVVEKNV